MRASFDVRRLGPLLAVVAATALSAPATEAADSGGKSSVVVLSYFAPATLPAILRAARAAGLFARAQVYVGAYGVNGAAARAVHAAGGLYAPMYSLVRKDESFFGRRQVSEADDARIAEAEKDENAREPRGAVLAGPVPRLEAMTDKTARLHWGREVGRRIRDDLRAAAAGGVRAEAWQLDEIWPTGCDDAGPAGQHIREYMTGVLEGLATGRRALGDGPMPGLVCVAHPWTLAAQRLTADVTELWNAMSAASLAVLGEEYPAFSGDPRSAAESFGRGQKLLASRGGIYLGLAARYVPMMTPGYRLEPGLGGNVRGLGNAQADDWRGAYIAARAAAGGLGLGEFNFLGGNAAPAVIADVLSQVSRALPR